jgi:hypothetical protein
VVRLADILVEVAMLRIHLLISSAAVGGLALVALPDHARAQAGCQPSIMQPCTNAPVRPNNAAPGPKSPVRTTDDDRDKDHSPRVQIDRDTEFKFGTGGIGLGRKF